MSKKFNQKRKRVYVSGPLTTGNRRKNLKTAVAVSNELIELGFAPFCPHLNDYIDNTEKYSWDVWLDIDEAWVAVSDIVLRIPGESPGGDREVALAEKLDIPVVYSVDELVSNFLTSRRNRKGK